MPLTTPDIAAATKATVRPAADRDAPFTELFTDTRTPADGGLFVALVGDTFDGHAFVTTAVGAGAGGVMVNRSAQVDVEGVVVFEVDDTGDALMDLARLVRRRHPGRFIAITGSVGKTTVKDMTAVALAPFGKVGSTIGNFNNRVGVPLSIFALAGDERFVVLELGMNAPGEIHELTEVVDPDVGVVTGAVEAHLEFFDSVDGIADAKSELFQAMRPGATAVANADDLRIVKRAMRLAQGGLRTYGMKNQADLTVQTVRQSPAGLAYDLEVDADTALEGLRLKGLGEHNALNAAAALAIVFALELPDTAEEVPALATAAIAIGRDWRPAKHRLQPVLGDHGLIVLDDCYNANPASTKAALRALAEVARDAPARCAVLGSMLELGPTAPQLHAEVGAAAVSWAGCLHVYATGPHARHVARGAHEAGARRVLAVDDAMELSEAVRDFAAPRRWMLLKGSRSQRLERLLPVLGATPQQGGS